MGCYDCPCYFFPSPTLFRHSLLLLAIETINKKIVNLLFSFFDCTTNTIARYPDYYYYYYF